jgi:hypothetical protein
MFNKGKISDEELAQIKATMPPNLALYKYPHKNGDVLFTPITKALLDKVTDLLSKIAEGQANYTFQDMEERIVDECVLWPKLTLDDKLKLPVGAIPSIAKAIQEKSLFLEVDIFRRTIGPDITSVLIKDFNYWSNITPEEVAEIKAAAGNAMLYRVKIGQWLFYTRPVTRVDTKFFLTAEDQDLAMCRCVTVWPKTVEWGDLPAGVIVTLANQITRLSGCYDADVDIEEA